MTLPIALETPHRRQVYALDDQLQIRPTQRLPVLTSGIEVEPPCLQPLAPHAIAPLLEIEYLELGAAPIDKDEQLASGRILGQLLPYQSRQPVEGLAHIRRWGIQPHSAPGLG